jgi:hypothetical protein
VNDPDFDCVAYGPDGREFGALCFVAEQGTRVCADLEQCQQTVDREQRRAFDRIQEGAARGEPDMVFLAGEITEPGQLLGGSEEADGG